ncbi:MAG TPA: sulfite exporter TauE/SafE family protein [Thermoanaerobaculia bacterium]|nr:sulfite exporter TauE/SafE family protein [Thermoanaerobaculia bacterium]
MSLDTLLDPHLAAVLAIVLIGAWLQGAVGIGLGIFAAPLLALLDPAFVPGPLLFAAMLLGSMMAVRERRAIVGSTIGWALLGRAPGNLLGAALVSVAAAAWLDLALGGLILGCVALSFSRWDLRPTRRYLVGAGLLSGITGTAASVGGPPMALVLQREEGPAVRATLSLYFLVATALSLITLTAFGEFDRDGLVRALTLTPAVLVGFLVSRSSHGWIDRGRLQPAILSVSGVAALWVLIRGVRALL